MKRQAAYNGEIGANGKAYKKGQFIAEQPSYQNRGSKKRKTKLRKQQVEPYIWEVPEDEDLCAIYPIHGVFCNLYNGEIYYNVIEAYKENPKKIESLVARFQNGERWYYGKHEEYI